MLPLLVTAGVLAALVAAGAMRYDHFMSWLVVRNLLVDNAFLLIAAIGATLVILSGGIDLSVGAVMALTSIVVARLIELEGMHPLMAGGLAIAGGAVFGAAQGSLIRMCALPAFLVTLAGMFLARGLAFWVWPQSIGIRDPFVAELLNDQWLLHLPLGRRGVTIPPSAIAALVLLVIGWWWLRSTPSGRAVRAIGDDEHSAELMGVPVGRTRVLTYALAGALSALAGIAFALYQQAGDPNGCRGLELDVIAAVVIGGTLLRGGVGSLAGTLLGVAILGLIQTIITFEGSLNSWWTRMVIGGLVLMFVAMQRLLERVAHSRGVGS